MVNAAASEGPRLGTAARAQGGRSSLLPSRTALGAGDSAVGGQGRGSGPGQPSYIPEHRCASCSATLPPARELLEPSGV